MHHGLDIATRAFEICEDIRHHLAGTVIGDLTTAIGLDNRDFAWIEQMLGLASLTEGVDRLVLNEPELIWRLSRAGFGKGLHGTPNRLVRRRTRPHAAQDLALTFSSIRFADHSTIDTMGCPCKALYKLSSCSREVAFTVKVNPM